MNVLLKNRLHKEAKILEELMIKKSKMANVLKLLTQKSPTVNKEFI